MKTVSISKFPKNRRPLSLYNLAFWWGYLGLCSLAHGQFGDVPMVVQEKCGLCHLVPSPFEIPREGWPPTLKSMLPFMTEKSLPITEPEFNNIEDYYRSNSREKLFLIPDDLAVTTLPFRAEAIGELAVHERPQITSVKFVDIDGDGKSREIMVTDNLNQSISCLAHDGTIWREKILAKGLSPVNTTPVDIDGDGDTDYAISLMGDINPSEELSGAFHLLINQGEGKYTTKIVIPGEVPRITDCAPADYDGDGDVDLVLAMFGWRKTGAFKVLEQTAPLSFTLRDIMEINAAMRVIPAHLNDDDRIDFLALISQEHESIVRFINEGGLKFRNELITRSSPSFGTSSLFLKDLDQDGDEDILFTNGDMMDESPGAKPYHGVRWLENDKWDYQLRDLARMPGCYDAKPCD
ncbi:MAG: VCBS repeat-containing protein, partial [Verrucomicrobiales bacterium]